MVKTVADILSLFGRPDKFKFLTHTFDPTRNDDFITLVNNCRIAVSECCGLIPDHLYELLFGFLYGKSWEDADGETHSFYCSSDECIQWCLNNPGKHPKENPEFESEFDAFRYSIRIYDRGLDKIITHSRDLFPDLQITRDRGELREVDIYVDVARLKQVIHRIFSIMNEDRFEGDVYVTVKPQHDVRGYHVRDLIIEQTGSFSDKSVQFIRDRIANGAGDLSSIRNLLQGNAYWSIESNWAEGPVRINILKEDIFQSDFEKLDPSMVTGFRHVIRLYDKTH